MRELVLRTRRAVLRMRLRNFADSQPTAGMTAIATRASCQCITSMAAAMPTIMVVPQTRSRNAQARMSVSLRQSAVRRAISQPTVRWSKYENDSRCRFANASRRMSWLANASILPAIQMNMAPPSASRRFAPVYAAAHSPKARNSKPLQIMAKEVGGLLVIARGQTDTGIGLLAEGVDIAESMRLPNGAPNPLKPAHELHGEALLAAGRVADAQEAFDTSLLRTPNRPLSPRGLARSQAARGHDATARTTCRRLVDGWLGQDVSWRREAETYLANHREP